MADTKPKLPRHFDIFEVPGPTIRLGAFPPLLAGGLLLATLAYPESRYADLRAKTAFRLSGRSGINTASLGADWFAAADGQGAMLPVDTRRLNGGSSQLEARLRKRIDAGRIALDPITAMQRGALPRHLTGKRWNRSAAIEEAIRQGGIGDAKDFQHRYWETSLAVIHLAAAWVAMVIKEKASHDFFTMVTDAGYRAALVQQAMRLEDLVVRSDLRIPSDVLIRFRP